MSWMIPWAIETFIASTLLMLLVLVVRAPVRKAFGPNTAYALWALPVLRMLLPPLPGDWQLSRLFEPLTRQAADAPGVVVGVLNPDTLPAQIAAHSTVTTIELGGHAAKLALVPPMPAASGPSVLMLAIGLWVIGTLLFLGYHLVSHSRFCRKLLLAARVDRTVAQGRVRVIETDAAHGPLAFGIWRKYVAFPRDFSERYDEVERDLALAHELGHHVRGDLIANWVALVVLALHWFNPVAWKAFRAFRADQEMACDALVLAGRAQALRHAYGRAIVKSAHGGAVSAACHLHTINELKGRLRMLSKTRKYSPARIATGALGVSALALAALGLTASGSQAATRITSKMERTLGVSYAPQEARHAPEAPEAAPPAPDAPKIEKRVYRIHTDDDGKDGKDGKKRVIIVKRDGNGPDVMEMGDLAELRDLDKMIPDIKSGNCKPGEKGPAGEGSMVIVHPKADGQKQKVMICVNRIQMTAKMGAEMAAKHKEMGLRGALMGLRHARASIEMQTDLTAEQKAGALKGIDEAIAQIEKDGGKDD